MEKGKKELVRLEHVSKRFAKGSGLLKKQWLWAVNDVSLEINEGEVLAIVGESGCGKTTLAKMLCRIHDVTEGNIWIDGKNIAYISKRKEKAAFCRKIQMIFQDPFGSLNPAHTAGSIIGRSVELKHPEYDDMQVWQRVQDLLETVGLTPTEDYYVKRPNQLSGGQRQRIVIARAMAMEPSILVADEPTSMLDVSIGIDIMNLMLSLKEQKKLTYLYITHNLAGARYMADRIAVMYAGSCVEQGDAESLVQKPLHPYTILLLASTPEPYRKGKIEICAKEELPDLTVKQKCCPFAGRCPKVQERCRIDVPTSYYVGERMVKCFLYENVQSADAVNLDFSIYEEKYNEID